MLNINNLIKYNIYILPFLIATGPFLSDLSITISSFYCLFCLLSKKIKIDFKILFITIFVLVLLNLSSIFSDYILFSLEKTTLIVRFILFGILLNFFIQKDEKFLLHLFYMLLISIIISINLGFIKLGYIYFNNLNLNLYLYSDEKIYGTYIFYISCIYIPIYLLIEKKLNRLLKLIFFTTLLFFFFLIIFSDQRIMILSYFLLLIFFLIKYFLIYNLKRKIIILSCLVMVFFVSITNPIIKHSIYIKTYSGVVTFLSEEKFNYLGKYFPYFIYTDYHNAYYHVSIQAFKSNPWFGKGPNTFRFFCSEYNNPINEKGCSTHPHNYYFQLLSESGIFVFSFFVLSYLFILGNFIIKTIIYFKSYFYNKYIGEKIFSFNVSSLSLLLFLNPLFPTSNFFNNYILIYLSIAISIYHLLLIQTNTVK